MKAGDLIKVIQCNQYHCSCNIDTSYFSIVLLSKTGRILEELQAHIKVVINDKCYIVHPRHLEVVLKKVKLT